MRPLREIKDENEWTLEDIAERAGLGVSTVGNFLSGKMPAGPKVLKGIAKAFKIPEEQIENPQPLDPAAASYALGTPPANPSAMGLHEGFDYAVRKMTPEQLIDGILDALKDDKGPLSRFATVRKYVDELERRARAHVRLENGN